MADITTAESPPEIAGTTPFDSPDNGISPGAVDVDPVEEMSLPVDSDIGISLAVSEADRLVILEAAQNPDAAQISLVSEALVAGGLLAEEFKSEKPDNLAKRLLGEIKERGKAIYEARRLYRKAALNKGLAQSEGRPKSYKEWVRQLEQAKRVEASEAAEREDMVVAVVAAAQEAPRGVKGLLERARGRFGGKDTSTQAFESVPESSVVSPAESSSTESATQRLSGVRDRLNSVLISARLKKEGNGAAATTGETAATGTDSETDSAEKASKARAAAGRFTSFISSTIATYIPSIGARGEAAEAAIDTVVPRTADTEQVEEYKALQRAREDAPKYETIKDGELGERLKKLCDQYRALPASENSTKKELQLIARIESLTYQVRLRGLDAAIHDAADPEKPQHLVDVDALMSDFDPKFKAELDKITDARIAEAKNLAQQVEKGLEEGKSQQDL